MTWRSGGKNRDDKSGGVAPIFRAAEYVRMSTEHQKYSTENQADAIREFAARRAIEVVRTYTDAGKSGLRLDGRDALKQLIDDVQSGRANFQTILVYDVSRWGRFQDADESAYYEYIWPSPPAYRSIGRRKECSGSWRAEEPADRSSRSGARIRGTKLLGW